MTMLATVPIDGNGNSGLVPVPYDFSSLLPAGDVLALSAPTFVSTPLFEPILPPLPPLDFSAPALVGNIWWTKLSIQDGVVGQKYGTTCTATTSKGSVLVVSVDVFLTDLGASDSSNVSTTQPVAVIPFVGAPPTATADLPAPGVAGRMYLLTDGALGLVYDSGTQWVHILDAVTGGGISGGFGPQS